VESVLVPAVARHEEAGAEGTEAGGFVVEGAEGEGGGEGSGGGRTVGYSPTQAEEGSTEPEFIRRRLEIATPQTQTGVPTEGIDPPLAHTDEVVARADIDHEVPLGLAAGGVDAEGAEGGFLRRVSAEAVGAGVCYEGVPGRGGVGMEGEEGGF